ncbi:oxygen-insensitive NADPH nitroreductase [Alphaproteobacteria bacterium]|nr:oxygen-insensitive NADPH nitroreductase [Alphaproteobacteria bacterium]
MNPTIDILMAHKSIRKFTEEPIENDVLCTIVKAGQAAASSSFLQGVTIIRVTDMAKRKQLAAVAGNQAQIMSAPEFLVFCADLNRPIKCCEAHGGTPTKGFTEQFIISTVDTALYAQNVAVAAESMGLGICYIGAIRNDPTETSALLELPLNVYPVFGLCIGHPAENPEVKPRLPLSVVLKDNTYNASKEAEQIAAYDIVARDYYATRSGNKKSQSWSEQMTGLLGKESRPHMRQFLANQGFEMK